MEHKLNPQIDTRSIGIKELREVTIYPLSLADQKKVVKIFSDAVVEISAQNTSSDMEVGRLVIDLILDNIQIVLKLVLAPDEKIDDSELTNTQLTDIAELIYDVNFDYTIKKLKALIDKVSPGFLPSAPINKTVETSTEPLQNSLNTPVTD